MNGLTENTPVKVVEEAPVSASVSISPHRQAESRRTLSWFGVSVFILSACFSVPLLDLLRYSLSEELYSHILLIPVIVGYLIWIDRSKLPAPGRGSYWISSLLAVSGVAVLAAFLLSSGFFSRNDSLTWTILPYCLFLAALAVHFLGDHFVRTIVFPLAFFFFIVPFPESVSNALEIGSQVASAEVFDWMISLTGIPHFRQGQMFSMPGLSLVIAQECSGIRSSFVLFLTSLLAGHMFFRSPWKKAALALFVIPLGFLRNGFRVLTLSLLSIHWDPTIMDSALHHRGGPIFFALSLVPFFLFLWWLRRTEGNSHPSKP